MTSDPLEGLFAAGLDNEQIADRLGIQQDTVRRKISRLGLLNSGPQAPHWPEEKVERLRTLWDEGLSCRKIAYDLDTTKNAVIGKAHRLGLPAREPNRRRQGHLIQDGLQPAIKERRCAPKRPYRVALKPSVLHPPPEQRIQFSELTNATCRYPIGNPRHEDFAFCGRKISGPGTYCDGHYAFTHRKT